MIAYGCILPHSPFLYSSVIAKKRQLAAPIETQMQNIADAMQAAGVDRLICIGGHPKYQRLGFSAYTAEQLHCAFAEFGDLINECALPMDWLGYTALREADDSTWPIGFHPVDAGEIDFSHALPLWILGHRQEELAKKPVLAINDFLTATRDERLAFGRSIASVLADKTIRYGLIISMEMSADKDANSAARHAISAHFAATEPQTIAAIDACSAGPLMLAHPILTAAGLRYRERIFEHADQTSLLLADFTA